VGHNEEDGARVSRSEFFTELPVSQSKNEIGERKFLFGPKMGQNEFECAFVSWVFTFTFYSPCLKPVGHASFGLLQVQLLKLPCLHYIGISSRPSTQGTSFGTFDKASSDCFATFESND